MDGKIYVIFMNPLKAFWLGYSEILFVPTNDQDRNSAFEFGDKNSIFGLKLVKK